MLTRRASEVFASTDINGNPVAPRTDYARLWGTEVERLTTAAVNGFLSFDTRVNLFADLAHPPNTGAYVWSDATAAFRGIYRKLGASGSGSWVKVADIPSPLIGVTITSGTNALVGTTADPLPAGDFSSLLIFQVTGANTGNVTLALNGGAAVSLRDCNGDHLPSGALTAGRILIATPVGAQYRLLVEGDYLSLLAQAEAARDAAIAAAAGFPAIATAANDGKHIYWDETADEFKAVYAVPTDPSVDLRDFMPSGFTARTGINTGTDITPAIEAACDALKARFPGGGGTIKIPPAPGSSLWMMKTFPNAAKLSGICIEGQHELYSKIVVAGNTGAAFGFTGAGGFTGGAVRRISLFREIGYSTLAYGISLTGDATNQADQFNIEDIYVSSLSDPDEVLPDGFWHIPLYIYGTARTVPKGIRVGRIMNAQLFKAGTLDGYGFGIFTPVQWSIDNLGVYAGTGSFGNNIYVGGGGTSGTNGEQLSMTRIACGGDWNCTELTRFHVEGFASTFSSNGTFDIGHGWVDTASGAVTGSIGANTNVTFR